MHNSSLKKQSKCASTKEKVTCFSNDMRELREYERNYYWNNSWLQSKYKPTVWGDCKKDQNNFTLHQKRTSKLEGVIVLLYCITVRFACYILNHFCFGHHILMTQAEIDAEEGQQGWLQGYMISLMKRDWSWACLNLRNNDWAECDSTPKSLKESYIKESQDWVFLVPDCRVWNDWFKL